MWWIKSRWLSFKPLGSFLICVQARDVWLLRSDAAKIMRTSFRQSAIWEVSLLLLHLPLSIIYSWNIRPLEQCKKSKIKLRLSNFWLWCTSLKVRLWCTFSESWYALMFEDQQVHSSWWAIVLFRTVSGLTNFLVCVTQILCQLSFEINLSKRKKKKFQRA